VAVSAPAAQGKSEAARTDVLDRATWAVIRSIATATGIKIVTLEQLNPRLKRYLCSRAIECTCAGDGGRPARGEDRGVPYGEESRKAS
jgi:hypothetical protein